MTTQKSKKVIKVTYNFNTKRQPLEHYVGDIFLDFYRWFLKFILF